MLYLLNYRQLIFKASGCRKSLNTNHISRGVYLVHTESASENNLIYLRHVLNKHMYTFTTEWEVAKCTACQFTMHKVASIHNKDSYFFSTE